LKSGTYQLPKITTSPVSVAADFVDSGHVWNQDFVFSESGELILTHQNQLFVFREISSPGLHVRIVPCGFHCFCSFFDGVDPCLMTVKSNSASSRVFTCDAGLHFEFSPVLLFYGPLLLPFLTVTRVLQHR
jgi:hypothetical protein